MSDNTIKNRLISKICLKSLGARFIAVVVAILAATMSVASYINYSSQKHQLTQQLTTRGEMLGEFVALVSPEAILGYDFALMDEYMKEISERPDIVYAIVVSPENINITSYLNKNNHYINDHIVADNIIKTVENINALAEILELTFPIKAESETLGFVKSGMTTHSVNIVAQRLLKYSLIQTGAIIILLSIGIYIVFRYSALGPILNLIHSVREISKGNLEHKIKVSGTTELANLAAAFNSMTDSLQNSYTELSDKNQQLVTATKAKSAFLANMSHEIRTPLTAIVGFGESLLDSHADESERILAINTIIRNGNHLQTIINDILDLSKIEADKLEIELVETSPLEILKDVEDLVSLQARGKNLVFNIHYNFPFPEVVVTDPLRLKQILINLCGNAIKFTQSGKVNIDVTCDFDHEYLIFAVADTGIGMSEKEAMKVFDVFTQADASTTRQFGGTGLGLPLTKRLTEMLGGGMQVESKKNIGSLFTAKISTGPLSKDKLILSMPKADPRDDPLQTIILPNSLTGSVLLAEDMVDNQRLLKLYIGKTQAELTVVENGAQALAAATHRKFDLILMDIQMPVMTGLEAVRALRSKSYEGPIVALTANSSRSDMDSYEKVGCDGFIAKPIVRETFMTMLARYLPSNNQDDVGKPLTCKVKYQKLFTEKFKGRILLAEDTLDNQRLIRMFVRKLGAELIAVENGKQAIEAAMNNDFDLILMDMQMPVMGGLEAIKILQQKGCVVPIVALTANALKHDRDQYEKAGCAGFIAKPINRNYFVETIAEFLQPQTEEKIKEEKVVSTPASPSMSYANSPVKDVCAKKDLEPTEIILSAKKYQSSNSKEGDVKELVKAIKTLTDLLGNINIASLLSVEHTVDDSENSISLVTSSNEAVHPSNEFNNEIMDAAKSWGMLDHLSLTHGDSEIDLPQLSELAQEIHDLIKEQQKPKSFNQGVDELKSEKNLQQNYKAK